MEDQDDNKLDMVLNQMTSVLAQIDSIDPASPIVAQFSFLSKKTQQLVYRLSGKSGFQNNTHEDYAGLIWLRVQGFLLKLVDNLCLIAETCSLSQKSEAGRAYAASMLTTTADFIKDSAQDLTVSLLAYKEQDYSRSKSLVEAATAIIESSNNELQQALQDMQWQLKQGLYIHTAQQIGISAVFLGFGQCICRWLIIGFNGDNGIIAWVSLSILVWIINHCATCVAAIIAYCNFCEQRDRINARPHQLIESLEALRNIKASVLELEL